MRHFGLYGIVGSMAALGALGWARPPGAWGTAAGYVLQGVMLAWVWLWWRHDHGPLCGLCVRRVPLDAQVRADRYSPVFAVLHWTLGTLRGRVVFAGVLTLFALSGVAPGVAGRMATDLMGVVVVLAPLGERVHGRYQPWCPYCRNGGRGPRAAKQVPKVPSTV